MKSTCLWYWLHFRCLALRWRGAFRFQPAPFGAWYYLLIFVEIRYSDADREPPPRCHDILYAARDSSCQGTGRRHAYFILFQRQPPRIVMLGFIYYDIDIYRYYFRHKESAASILVSGTRPLSCRDFSLLPLHWADASLFWLPSATREYMIRDTHTLFILMVSLFCHFIIVIISNISPLVYFCCPRLSSLNSFSDAHVSRDYQAIFLPAFFIFDELLYRNFEISPNKVNDDMLMLWDIRHYILA